MIIQRVTLVTEPASAPITLARAKEHLRVDHDDEDTIIQAYIEAATNLAENYIGRSLVDTSFDLHQDSFGVLATSPIEIPRSPLLSVDAIFYRQGDDAEIEVSDADYYVDPSGARGRVFPLSSWPTITPQPGAVRIRFRSGYIDNGFSPPIGSIPRAIESAILLTLGSFYANRENEVVGASPAQMPFGTERLLRHFVADLQIA